MNKIATTFFIQQKNGNNKAQYHFTYKSYS
jgi:hypothetical protein